MLEDRKKIEGWVEHIRCIIYESEINNLFKVKTTILLILFATYPRPSKFHTSDTHQ